MLEPSLRTRCASGQQLEPAFLELAMSGKIDIEVFEDDVFADFEPTLSLRLAILDDLNCVIRIGSFSKVPRRSPPP